VFPILCRLLVTARLMPPDLDGRAAPIKRKEILQWLEASGLPISREALRRLLKTLQAARLVELFSSQVRLTRLLLDDLASLGVRIVGSRAACSEGTVPAPDSSGVTGEMPRSSDVSAHSPISSGGRNHAPGTACAPKSNMGQKSSVPTLEEFLPFFKLFESANSDWIVGAGEATPGSPAKTSGMAATEAATSESAKSSGASPAASPPSFPDEMPSSGNVYPAGWASAELDAILKRFQAASGQ
jgi:hypothetical protein